MDLKFWAFSVFPVLGWKRSDFYLSGWYFMESQRIFPAAGWIYLLLRYKMEDFGTAASVLELPVF